MTNYKVTFKGIEIGTLTVSQDLYTYVANKNTINEIGNKFPLFDILKKDVSAENIPFFKVRLEKQCETFETDDYELIPV